MDTYRCAYRDPHSPLTPLTPISDVTLRKTLRDHSPSLVPIKSIVLNECPTPKRKRAAIKAIKTNKACSFDIVVSSDKTHPDEKLSKNSSYLHNLKKILTPNSRHNAKSIDLAPFSSKKYPSSDHKRSRFTCFQSYSSDTPTPNSPRVSKILQDIGLEKYKDIFQKEEIDMEVFKLLSKSDLLKLGIQEEKDVTVILNTVKSIKNM